MKITPISGFLTKFYEYYLF